MAMPCKRVFVLSLSMLLSLFVSTATAQEQREVLHGLATSRIVQGEPYDLGGKRIVFLNWYYVHPGNDADWRLPNGQSARIAGSFGPWDARFRHENHAYGIRLVAQPAQHVGPVAKFERPWESKGICFNTVMQDKGIYRAWGACDTAKKGDPPASRACYFESKDGMNWDRPDLGLAKFAGSRHNNLLAEGISLNGVFLDPTAPPQERYKSVSSYEISAEEFKKYRQKRSGPDDWEPRALRGNNTVTCIRGVVSPDGIHWKYLAEPLCAEYSDTLMVAHYDQVLRKYVLYTRWWQIGPLASGLPFPSGLPDIGRRSIGRSESDDFRHFPVSRMIYEPTPDMGPSDVLYTNCFTTIPGAPQQRVMFPAVWHQDDDTTTIVMLSSNDGRVWQRVPGPAALNTPPFGQWDGGCIFASPNLVELPDGSFALPYTGYKFPHKYSRGQWEYRPGYAVWPKGRLVALEAPERGQFTMVTIMPPGRKLLINAVTKRSGEIRVQVDGVGGRSLDDCDPIIGDQYRREVTWKGKADLGHENNKPIRLRFRMEKAQLFGLEFE
jgi:hypothetical protein